MAADGARMEDFAARGQEVDAQIKAGDTSAAVLTAVQNPPLNSKDPAIKVCPQQARRVGFISAISFDFHTQLEAATIVYRAFDAIVGSKIPAAVKTMDLESLDTAMKYVYRAMSENHNCSHMLKWHAAIVSHAGLATISRVIASRKTV